MPNHPQHWHARTPWRMQVLGVLSFSVHSSQFYLQSGENTATQRIYITRIWQSPFAITVQLQHQSTLTSPRVQLTFWRHTLLASCWRKLQIYLGRYQLQYQFSDLKGEQ